MKIAHLLFFLFLATTSAFAQELEIYSADDDLEDKKIYSLFATDVKLRKEPNTTSEVLITLAIGTPIQIIKKMEEKMAYAEDSINWYKVKYKNMTGYVLKNFMAVSNKAMGRNVFLFNTYRIGEMYQLQVRVLRDGILSSDKKYMLNNSSFEIEVEGDRGLNTIENVVFIHYFAEACGVDGGGIYLFYTGEKLIKAAELQKVVDGGVFWYSEEFIFPEDDEMLINKVRYTRDAGEITDEETNQLETKTFSREYEWTGTEWNPPLDQE